MSAATQAGLPFGAVPQTHPRAWTAFRLRELATKARSLGDLQTANFILSGTFGFFGEETVPVSEQAAAMLDALEAR